MNKDNLIYGSTSYIRFGYLSLFIFPLSTLYLSLKDYRQPQAKNLFWLFCVFLGMIHVYNPDGGTTSDGADYANALIQLHNTPMSWESYSSSFFAEGERTIDVYQPTMTFLIAQMTDDPHVLFLFYAIVFGFFYSRNIWFLLDRMDGDITVYHSVLILAFILISPIWYINGARMWTALHVFMYSVFPYIVEKDRSKLIWLFITPLIHFSFAIPLVVFILFMIVPFNLNILFILYCITLTINSLDMGMVSGFMTSVLPSFMLPRVDSYAKESNVEKLQEVSVNLSAHVVYSAKIYANFSRFIIILLYIKSRQYLKTNSQLKSLYNATLFFFIFSNIASLVPSGGRYTNISQFIFMFLLIKYMQIDTNFLNLKIFRISIYLLLLPLLVGLRIGTDFYGISILISNPITCWWFESNVPVIQFIKSIF